MHIQQSVIKTVRYTMIKMILYKYSQLNKRVATAGFI